MFERFTDRARRALVLAQEEAQLLRTPYIGTEHVLLGLIHDDGGVAAQALAQLGISRADVRRKVEEHVGVSSAAPSVSPPFTARAKRVLDLSQREALQLGHNYIGTEHILLGLTREGSGVAAQVLIDLGLDLVRVQSQIVEVLSGHPTPASVRRRVDQESSPVPRPDDPVECSFCGRRPPDSGRLISGRTGARICEHCVTDYGTRKPDAGHRDDLSPEP